MPGGLSRDWWGECQETAASLLLAVPGTPASSARAAPPALPRSTPPSTSIELDAIMREAEEKRAKRSKDQQRLYDDMLSAIFKSVFEDTVPDSAVGIYSSGEKDRMGSDIPKVIDFRSLPVIVQDNLMRAESPQQSPQQFWGIRPWGLRWLASPIST